ncbi:MAG: GDP-mannose 4,6-dehydratase [Candidatus Omnitrophica bacterium]|nr:GDP-mannose 4,6-dehydratase [Candidatus Omnitrophota bacterium]
MTKVLITGITGFAGSYLAEFILKKKDIKLFGIKRWRSKLDNISHIKERIILKECDIKDASSVREILDEIRPNMIFHLAAQSFVLTSWNAPSETLTTNIIGELNIFEAIRQIGINPLIQIAGSSEEYGLVGKDDIPIKETTPLNPLSPYAVSKIGQDLLGYQYYKSYGLRIIRTRGFNHTGPRRNEVFVCSNFANQIARIEKGLQEGVLYTGDTFTVRDFTDVRDMVRGYWLALEKGEPGEVYNICSGRGYSIKEALDMLKSYSKKNFIVKKDPSRLRPSDVPVLIGDNTKFVKRTGWRPEIPFEKTLKDILDYWRENVKKEVVTPAVKED